LQVAQNTATIYLPILASAQFGYFCGSPQEFGGTRILGCFLEDHKFCPGRGHALGLQQQIT
jgi:hypothetical protein